MFQFRNTIVIIQVVKEKTQNKHSMKTIFQNIFVKMGVIFALILILLIPAVMVQGLIKERMQRQWEAIEEVNSKHADAQEIVAPILTIPYKDVPINTSDVSRNASTKYFHILPERLHINSEISPEKRSRGLFDVIVYKGDLEIDGEFAFDQLEVHGINPNQLMLEKSFVTIGISDLKGVREQVDLKLGDSMYRCDPGVISKDVVESGLNTRVKFDSVGEVLPFRFKLAINGSEKLNFLPVGKVTEVDMNSKWKDPSFGGKFLPEKRKVDKNGFTAHWKVLHINRNFPQAWTGKKHHIMHTSFGVELQLPVDVYQKSMRVAKYAILFIVLTYLVFFFVEILNRILIHPIQYILVGIALILFYVLLLAFSEQVNFDVAYLIAAFMTMILIFLYCRSILKSWALASMTAVILSILYGFIFIIIQIQDYALLFGSLGIFLILAVTMYFSRKIDWFEIGKSEEPPKVE